ncbi:MAG TPA: NAD-dependent succinate-semialdehyde dehydrogenase [Bdellovibrionota bacterium]|jgi:succinate-semialdehyde dehydrogenase/glutarate-semialdehyde dehydrogenase
MEKQPTIITYRPEDGQELARYATHSREEVNSILQGSRQAFLEWRRTTPEERSFVMNRLADLLAEQKQVLTQLMRSEMGKSLEEAAAEIEKCVSCARYYAENGAKMLEPQNVPTEAKHSFVSYEPLGTVLAIMPWNFPFWQAIRCLVPALTAGNSVLLKHASNVTGCALALERLVYDATERKQLFRAVLVPGSETLGLIASPEVAAVSLTGSTEVGRQVAAVAGHELKKCVLELGGSDAYIILADANLASAAKICAQSRLINAGQSCIAAKRFVVDKSVLPAFTELFVKEIQSRKISPLARADLREELQKQVDASLKQGAQLLCGGKIPDGPGYHYPPTVLTGVRPGMTAFDEELFGPVAALIEAKDEAEALELANRTSFGLGAAVFTKDLEKAERIARFELEAGSCFGNALVRSDPRLPFGGIKASGFGRELGAFGLREFTNIKTVYIDA